MVEDVPRRHRHDAGPDALLHELFVRLHGEAPLAARGDPDHLGGAAWRVGENVRSLRDASRRRVPRTIRRRERRAVFASPVASCVKM
jgi:hypothetical protein